MEFCKSSVGLVDIAIFMGQCVVAMAVVFTSYQVGSFLSRLVSLKSLKRMAEKPTDSWFVFGLIFLSVLATLAVGLAVVFYFSQVKHFSSDVATTIGMAVCAGLLGICLGFFFEVRDRVDYVRWSQPTLLEV
jgi:hypothetical protein